jgi:hypothetical protein
MILLQTLVAQVGFEPEWESKRGFAPLFYFFPLSFEGEGERGGEGRS